MTEISGAQEVGMNQDEYRERQIQLGAEYVVALAVTSQGRPSFSVLREGHMILGLSTDDYVLGANRAHEDSRLTYTTTGFEPVAEDIGLSDREQKIVGFVQKLIELENAKEAECRSLANEIRGMEP